jgi:hypothetical protein
MGCMLIHTTGLCTEKIMHSRDELANRTLEMFMIFCHAIQWVLYAMQGIDDACVVRILVSMDSLLRV